MAYKPYPIYDLKQGKMTDKEPWLLPLDAFEAFNNCHLKRGVLEKRKGYTEFGRIINIDTTTGAPSFVGDAVMGIYNYYKANVETLIAFDQDRINRYITDAAGETSITVFADAGGGEVTVTAAAHGMVTDDICRISGTTSYNGIFKITKVDADNFKITDTWVADDATGTVIQEPFIDLTRTSIRFKAGDPSVQVNSIAVTDTLVGAGGASATVEDVIIDTGSWVGNDANGTIIFTNGSVSNGPFVDGENLYVGSVAGGNLLGTAAGANTDLEFTGDDSNYFWMENWDDIGYITNNTDQIRRFQVGAQGGYYSTLFNIDLVVVGGPDNDVNTAMLIFSHKERIILLRTQERGLDHYQRARFCVASTPTSWNDGDYLDAPTEDWIVAADFLGDDLIVWFERSIWKLAYTGDSSAPFRWEKLVDTEGAYATYSLVSFSDEIIGVGPTRFVGFDGREAYGIDEKIPDFLLEWNQSAVNYCYGLVLEEESQAWISYAEVGQDTPNKAVILNYEKDSWATYTLPIHCLGYSSLQSDLLWDDITDDWDDIDWAWDDRSLQSGYPTTLMGAATGYIYQLNDGGTDDGAAIEFEATTGRWNPFAEQGVKADLGWLDFLVDKDANVTFDVELFLNQETTKYDTKTITCSGSGDKVWKRVYVNTIAEFHRLRIYNDGNIDGSPAANRPRIHAIVPWFQPAGRLI